MRVGNLPVVFGMCDQHRRGSDVLGVVSTKFDTRKDKEHTGTALRVSK